MPSQPCSASLCQNSSVTAAGSAIRRRTNWVSHSLSRNLRAVSRNSSCSSVNPISIDWRSPSADLERKPVRLQEGEAVPISSLKGNLLVLDAEEAAPVQPERVFPLEDRPLAVLEDVLHDADHLRFGKIAGEH